LNERNFKINKEEEGSNLFWERKDKLNNKKPIPNFGNSQVWEK